MLYLLHVKKISYQLFGCGDIRNVIVQFNVDFKIPDDNNFKLYIIIIVSTKINNIAFT